MVYIDPTEKLYTTHRHEEMANEEKAERLRDPWWSADSDADSMRAVVEGVSCRRRASTDSADDCRTEFGLKRALDKVAGGPMTLIGDRTMKDQIYLEDGNTRLQDLTTEIEGRQVEFERALSVYVDADARTDPSKHGEINHDFYRADLKLSRAQKEYNIYLGELKDLHDMPSRSRDHIWTYHSAPRNLAFKQRYEHFEYHSEKHNPDPQLAQIAQLSIDAKKHELIANSQKKKLTAAEDEVEKLKVLVKCHEAELAKTVTILQAEVDFHANGAQFYIECNYDLHVQILDLVKHIDFLNAELRAEEQEHKALRRFMIGYHASSNDNIEQDLQAAHDEQFATGYSMSRQICRTSQHVDESVRHGVSSNSPQADADFLAASLTNRNVTLSYGGPTDIHNGGKGLATVDPPSKADQSPGPGYIVLNYGDPLPATRFNVKNSVAHAAAYGRGEDELCNDFCAPPSTAGDTDEGGVPISDNPNDKEGREGSITPTPATKRQSASGLLSKVASVLDLRRSKSIRSIRGPKVAAKRIYSQIEHKDVVDKPAKGVVANVAKEVEVCKWHEPGMCVLLSSPSSFQAHGKVCQKVGQVGKDVSGNKDA
ncbi:hypothetical protein LTR86_007208 [Recurvomyces mirabilis]|nr:hypothetical protein LTR86_007208 [Recurvomyces mirabilis]